MVTYADTSLIVPLYVPEPLSTNAQKIVTTLSRALPFNQLHQLETRNAIRRKIAAKQATVTQVRNYLANLEADIDAGIWISVPTDWDKVYAEAEQLGARFTAKLNTRSLDILHVALAISAGYTSFVTCDGNQAKLAKAAGLSCTLVREQTPSSPRAPETPRAEQLRISDLALRALHSGSPHFHFGPIS
jgi:predicted nucleic acid-binding protein